MNILQKYGSFVKEQIDHYDKMAVKFRANPERLGVYSGVASKLRELLADAEAEALAGQSCATPNKEPVVLSAALSKLPPGFFSNPLALSAADVVGLPDDVVKELNISPGDKTEIAIVELINAAGGTLVLDKIIAGLFHTTGEKHQRNQLTSKLYRMSRKGVVFSVSGKKGVYTTEKPSTSGQADLLDGGDGEEKK